MSAALHLAGPGDMGRLAPMLASCHAEAGIESDEAARAAALAPLLEGSPYGAVYLIGPRSAPVGFIAVTFGWSLALGGMDGVVDAFWIRPGVRGRGMGTEVLAALLPRLDAAGVRAIHLDVDTGHRAERLFARQRFAVQDDRRRMTRTVRRA